MCDHYTDAMVDDMRKLYEEQIEVLKAKPITEHPDVQKLIILYSQLQTKYDTLQASHTKLLEEVKYVKDRIDGWREVIAELDDMAKSEPLGKAMWVCLDQIDIWKNSAKRALSEADKISEEAK